MKKNKFLKVLSILFIVVVLCSILVVPFGANAWTESQQFYTNGWQSRVRFDFTTLGTAPSTFYYGYSKSFASLGKVDYMDKIIQNISGWDTVIDVPLNGNNLTSSVGADYYSYGYFDSIDSLRSQIENCFRSYANTVTDYDSFTFNACLETAEINHYHDDFYSFYSTYDTQLGYLCYPFYVYGNIELTVQATATNSYGFLPVDFVDNKALVNVIYGANNIEIDCNYSDDVNYYMFAMVLPIWETRDITLVYDYYKDKHVEDFEHWSRFHQALDKAIDKGHAMGQSTNFGENLLGSTLNSPIDGLNQFVLFTVGDVNVTLGGVVGCVIALTLFIIFLKMFAGG